MKVYNRLDGQDREWAVSHKWSRAEYAERVKKGKQAKGNVGVARVAGDGQYGFSSRRVATDPVGMTEGLDKQYLKNRKSIAKPRKNTCRLWSKHDLMASDEIVQAEINKQNKKDTRKRNRNKAARNGRKQG